MSGRVDDMSFGSAEKTLSHMEKPCTICHEPLLVIAAEYDQEAGWVHRSCIKVTTP